MNRERKYKSSSSPKSDVKKKQMVEGPSRASIRRRSYDPGKKIPKILLEKLRIKKLYKTIKKMMDLLKEKKI